MPAETVDTYTMKPAARSTFAASPEKAKAPEEVVLPIQPKVGTPQKIKTDKTIDKPA